MINLYFKNILSERCSFGNKIINLKFWDITRTSVRREQGNLYRDKARVQYANIKWHRR